ncbi:MAG: hypothetical protein ACOX2O_08990 [Bdellovibrionota bacterium]|jgi:hypothetical protein
MDGDVSLHDNNLRKNVPPSGYVPIVHGLSSESFNKSLRNSLQDFKIKSSPRITILTEIANKIADKIAARNLKNFENRYGEKIGSFVSLGSSTTEHIGYSYKLELGKDQNGKDVAILIPTDKYNSFGELQERRKSNLWGSPDEFMAHKTLANVGTSYFMFVNMFNMDEYVGTYLICTTKHNNGKTGLFAISGYVNCADNDGKPEGSIQRTAIKEVREEALIIGEKWHHWNFSDDDNKGFQVFGKTHTPDGSEIKVTPLRDIPAVFGNIIPVIVDGKVGGGYFIDERSCSAQYIACGIANIDLAGNYTFGQSSKHCDETTLWQSESRHIDNKIHEVFAEDGLVLLQVDEYLTNFTGKAFKCIGGTLRPLSDQEKANMYLSEAFNVEIVEVIEGGNNYKLAWTTGDISYENFLKKYGIHCDKSHKTPVQEPLTTPL